MSLNPEGPLGSYLCDITLPAIPVMLQFLFCGTKKVNRIFIGRKKSNFPFFSPVCFLISCFLMFLYHSFHGWMLFSFNQFSISCYFWSLIYAMFSQLSYWSSRGCWSVWKSCIIIQNIFVLFVLGYLLVWSVITGQDLGILQTNEDFILREDIPWRSYQKESCPIRRVWRQLYSWWEHHPTGLYCRG